MIEVSAMEIHGITDANVAEAPEFGEIAGDLGGEPADVALRGVGLAHRC